MWPFNYVNNTQGYNDVVEVAWSEMIKSKRSTIKPRAKHVREISISLLVSWEEVENVYGYTSKKDSNHRFYAQRCPWLKNIGMDNVRDEELQRVWDGLSHMEKHKILGKARVEKERFLPRFRS